MVFVYSNDVFATAFQICSRKAMHEFMVVVTLIFENINFISLHN